MPCAPFLGTATIESRMFSQRHRLGSLAFIGLTLATGCSNDLPPETDRLTPPRATPVSEETEAQNRLDQPISQYSTLLESDPDNADLLLQRATAWLQQERFEDASADLSRAIAIDPDNGEARLRLARVLRRTDRPQDAILQLEQALTTDLSMNDRLLAHRNAAALLQAAGRDREALSHLDAALTLAPANVELKRRLARLLASSPDDTVRDGDRALTLAEELFGQDRSLSNAEILAMALAAVGRFEEAANWQRRLIAEVARFGYLDEIPRLRQAQNHYKQRRPAIGVPAARPSRTSGTE